jgi:hypothetical protein
MNSEVGLWRYAGSTARRTDDHRGSCASGNDQGDVAWRLVLSAARRVTLTARPSGNWSPLLAVSRGNCDRRPEDLGSGVMERESSCSTGAAGSEVTVSSVLPAGTWFVVVDGNGGSGDFTLDVAIEAATDDGGPAPTSATEADCAAVPSNAARVALEDDEGSAPINLGFNFDLYGARFTRLAISSNGFVQLLGATGNPSGISAYGNQIIPSSGAPNAILAAFWDDLNPNNDGNRVRWWTSTSPRSLTVRWVDVQRWRRIDQRVTFEVNLDETGAVTFRYCSVTPNVSGSAATGTSATVGIESDNGRRGVLYSHLNGFAYPRRTLRFAPR